MKRIMFLLFLSVSVFEACKTVGKTSASRGSSEEDGSGPFDLKGRNETLLVVSGMEGKAVFVKAGNSVELTRLATFPSDYQDIISNFGKFYLHSGTKVMVLDPKAPNSQPIYDLGARGRQIAVDVGDIIYMNTDKGLRKVELLTGKELAFVPAPAERMMVNERYIFLAGSALLTVLNKADLKVLFTVPLEGKSPKGEQEKMGSPIVSISYQEAGELLYIVQSAYSETSVSAGHTATVDMKNRTLKSIENTNIFGGSLIALNKAKKFFELQHTSTPSTSTHVVLSDILPDGSHKGIPGVNNSTTIVDLFDHQDVMEFNSDESLATIVSSCFVGFCIAGKGVVFLDLRNNTRLPNLSEEELGFLPERVVFAKGNQNPTVIPAPPPTPAPGGSGQAIVSRLNNLCIDLKDGLNFDGARPQMWGCNGLPAQKFTREGDTFRVKGKCLDVAGANPADGTAIQIATCNGNAAQKFTLNAAGDLVSLLANKCVDIGAWNREPGAQLILWPCTGNLNQKWDMR